MATSLEELRVLQTAEKLADEVWKQVVSWDIFAREVVGGQLARAADSVGANIAESFGRFNYGEKLQFIYYARGSLFETKYWLNRATQRRLLTPDQAAQYAAQLSETGRQLNAFANSLKTQRRSNSRSTSAIREATAEYRIDSDSLPFTDTELDWLRVIEIRD